MITIDFDGNVNVF